jgi:DNA-binding XRE family transcriptional regulator
MNYKKLVKEIREKLIITQGDLAELLGVSFASINRWETGKHEPTIKTKRKIVELRKINNIVLEEKE